MTALHLLMETCPDSKREQIATVVSQYLSQGQGCLDDTELYALNRLLEQFYANLGNEAKFQISGYLASSSAISSSLVLRLVREDVEIATPLLTNSPVLSTEDLKKLVREQSNGHRLAISNRNVLNREVTELLITLGDLQVKLSVSSNLGADISPEDYDRLVAAIPDKVGGRVAHLRKQVLLIVEDYWRDKTEMKFDPKLEEQTVSVAFEAWFSALAGGHVTLGAVVARMCGDKNLYDIVRILAGMSGMSHENVAWLMLRADATGIAILCKMLGIGSTEFDVLSRVRSSHLRLPQFMSDMWVNNYKTLDLTDAKRLFGLLMLKFEGEGVPAEQDRLRA